RRLRGLGREMRLANLEFDLVGPLSFGAGQMQHEIVIVRTEPIPEKARRDRKVHDGIVDTLKLDTPKPTAKDILAQFRAYRRFHPHPGVAGRGLLLLCHGSSFAPLFSFAPLRTARYALEQSTLADAELYLRPHGRASHP